MGKEKRPCGRFFRELDPGFRRDGCVRCAYATTFAIDSAT